MSNSLLTSSMITKEVLRRLKNSIVLAKSVNRQYDDRFAQTGAKVGDTINIRKPNRYVANDGPTLVIQDTQDESVALTLDTHKHVGMAFSQKDLTLSLDDFSERIIAPATDTLANAVDYALYQKMYQAVYSSVGVPSATALPSTLKGFLQGKAKIATLGGPSDGLVSIVDPNVEVSLVDGLKGLLHASAELDKQYKKGEMGRAGGSMFKMSQNVIKHTAGAPAGAPAVKTTIAAEGAAAIAVDGITGSITNCYKKGDVIQIGGVYAVNPLTKQSTGELAQFVVTADTNSVTNEIASLPLSPAMYLTGAKQNISAYPVDGALITLFGHATNYAGVIAPQNMIFHKDAFVLGCADFELPKGMDMASTARDPESGLSVSFVRGFDIVNHRMISRLDILFGSVCVNPEFACRVVGQPT